MSLATHGPLSPSLPDASAIMQVSTEPEQNLSIQDSVSALFPNAQNIFITDSTFVVNSPSNTRERHMEIPIFQKPNSSSLFVGQKDVLLSPPHAVPLLRAYSTAGIDHFYTTDAAEMQNAVAKGRYNNEGTTGYVFSDEEPHSVPLYRLYNRNTVDYFYTTDEAERKNAIQHLQYNDEGIAGYVYPDAACGALALYRLYSNVGTDHFYTMSAAERDNASNNLGYTQEGIAGYIFPF